MIARVDVAPALLHWACERNGKSVEDYAARYPHLASWVAGEARPTVKQLEDFAAATYTPFGYFYLDEPPDEALPIQDFRTLEGAHPSRPSPDLLDTLYACLRRQEWYREHARVIGGPPLAFVGRVNVGADVVSTAADIRRTLGYQCGTSASGAKPVKAAENAEAALTSLVGLAEEAGILVMRNTMVGHNARRPLRVDEFRGFALTDPHAPLVFVNANDARAAQMFTLVHEIAHLWAGQSALSDPDPSHDEKRKAETWCDSVAAETLVPMAALQSALVGRTQVLAQISSLASTFRVSELVILRRLRDAGHLEQAAFVTAYRSRLQGFLKADAARKEQSRAKPGGPSFYVVAPLRVSKRFARALVESTLDGHTLYRDAFQLLGVSSTKALEGIGKAVGAL